MRKLQVCFISIFCFHQLIGQHLQHAYPKCTCHVLTYGRYSISPTSHFRYLCNTQTFPTVTPVSIYTYESDLNEEKRNIIIPKKTVIDKIVGEIGDILNDQS